MSMVTSRAKLAFNRMRDFGMTGWVGAGDPEAVGTASLAAVGYSIDLRSDMAILDFGCGIGRLMVPLAEFLTAGACVGIDIVPGMIEFCEKQIQPIYPNSTFVLSSSKNPHYESYKCKSELIAMDLTNWAEANVARFDLICAFSVFTHLDPDEARSVLKVFAEVLKPKGVIYMTAFLDAPDNLKDRRLSVGQTFKDCYPGRTMSWVVHSASSLVEIAADVGLSVRRMLFGSWRGGAAPSIRRDYFQDALVLCRPKLLPEDFDAERYLALHPDVAQARVDAAEHYLTFGINEGRAYR